MYCSLLRIIERACALFVGNLFSRINVIISENDGDCCCCSNVIVGGGGKFCPDDANGGGSGNLRPNGMRERQVNVAAATDWTDTGVEVRAGQTISDMRALL